MEPACRPNCSPQGDGSGLWATCLSHTKIQTSGSYLVSYLLVNISLLTKCVFFFYFLLDCLIYLFRY